MVRGHDAGRPLQRGGGCGCPYSPTSVTPDDARCCRHQCWHDVERPSQPSANIRRRGRAYAATCCLPWLTGMPSRPLHLAWPRPVTPSALTACRRQCPHDDARSDIQAQTVTTEGDERV